MVFFASPDENLEVVANQLKSKLMSFIWVPWEEVDAYIEKSDAVLIGPGFMRFAKEQSTNNIVQRSELDGEGKRTREITERLLKKFPDKKWVIDAGSLQTMDAEWIPQKAIITPNKKEFELLFGDEIRDSQNEIGKLENTSDGGRMDSSEVDKVQNKAKKYNCTLVLKGPETIVASPDEYVIIKGGNPGLTKGGTGDVLAGLTAALYAKNNAFLAAASASFIAKAAADELYEKVGVNYNADDLADKILGVFRRNLE